MDVLYKGAALLACQALETLRIALAVPHALCLCAFASLARGGAVEDDPGAIFYEGHVAHTRRRPVRNSFE
jgi:hypothetical protein